MAFVLDCVSDSHDTHDELVFPPFTPAPGESWVLLHAGDFSYRGGVDETDRFVAWLRAQPHARKVVVAGNHELSFDPITARRSAAAGAPFHGEAIFDGVADYLEGTSLDLLGLRIFGSPYSLRFFDWAFQTDRGEDAVARWAHIPRGTDVVLVHGPPHGHGDACGDDDPARRVSVGDPWLLARLREIHPRLCVFGHIHEGAGVTRDEESDVTMVNASVLDERYRPRGTFVRVRLSDDGKMASTTVERFAHASIAAPHRPVAARRDRAR